MRWRLEVVPDSERVEQRLLDAGDGAPFVDARGLWTMSELLAACEATRWAGVRVAPPLLVQALLQADSGSAREAFGPAAHTADFAAQAAGLIGALREQDATAQRLAEAASKASGGTSARASALATLWAHLDATLAERGLVDLGEVVRLATRRLREVGLPPRLAGVAAITIRHVHDLFPARFAFLEALAGACHRAGVPFELAWPASGGEAADIFVLDVVRQVEARWQHLDADVSRDVSERPFAWLGAAAFAAEVTPRPASGLSCFSAADVREEAREVARRVRLLLSRGVPMEEVAVVLRDASSDTSLWVEALEAAGVPVRARRGASLLGSPVGRLVLTLLELPDDDFPVESVAAVLESPYVASSSPLPPGVDVRSILSAAGVRDDVLGAEGGVGAYETRLANLQRLSRDAERTRAVVAVRAAVVELLSAVRSIPEEGTPGSLLHALWAVVRRLKLTRPPAGLRATGAAGVRAQVTDAAVARDGIAAEALEHLLADLEAVLQPSGLVGRRMRRVDFARWVRHASSDVSLVARGPRTAAVWLLDAKQLAGRHFRHVFIAGLVDGRFPGRPSPQPLLSQSDRAQLNGAARASLFRLDCVDGAQRLTAQLAEDRLLFHLCLASAEETVTLSHARLDAVGREQLESPFIDGVRRAVAGLEEAPRPRAAVVALDEVLTERELRTRVALEMLSPPATRQSAVDRRREAMAAALEGEAWLEEARAVASTEEERLTYFSDSERAAEAHSGLVRPSPEVLERLAFGADRPLSSAELGSWGQCAFRGMALHLLRLSGAEAAGEEVDSRVGGNLLHAALELLMPVLQKRKLWGPDADEAALQQAVEKAIAAAACRAEKGGSTGHPALWALTQQRAAAQLVALVRKEDVLWPFGAGKTQSEVHFGDDESPPELQAVRLPAALPGETDVFLRGRIDRIDEVGEGLVAIDYKSSGRTKRDEGASLLVSDFQMPLYLLVLKQQTKGPVDAAWVGVKKREALKLREVLDDDDSVEALLAVDAASRAKAAEAGTHNLANSVHGLLKRLRGGDFGARPSTCRYCDFKPVCRIPVKKEQEDSQ